MDKLRFWKNFQELILNFADYKNIFWVVERNGIPAGIAFERRRKSIDQDEMAFVFPDEAGKPVFSKPKAMWYSKK